MFRHIVSLCMLPALALPASAALVETVQSGVSEIRINGVLANEDSDAQTDGDVSVFARVGNATTPEVRAAARARVTGEMAANVRLDDKFQFSHTQVSEAISVATLKVTVAPDTVFLRNAVLDFLLPPSFVEVTSSGELQDNALEMVLFADLRVCFDTLCSSTDSRFSFQTTLTASWQEFDFSIQTEGEPGLDLSALEAPTVTDAGGPGVGFMRTTTLEFATFEGHLDLGLIPIGLPLTLEYQMQARGSGRMAANIGLAAINDPFILSTDPIQPGMALNIAVAPAVVPLPAAWLVLASGSLLTGALARRGARRPSA